MITSAIMLISFQTGPEMRGGFHFLLPDILFKYTIVISPLEPFDTLCLVMAKGRLPRGNHPKPAGYLLFSSRLHTAPIAFNEREPVIV